MYHPFMSVSDAQCAVCVSPSKAFNIAGLQIANIIVKDDSIRRRVDRAININEVCDVNPFGVIALQAAYTQSGEEWLNALNDYIYANYDYVRHWLSEHHPEWKAVTLEGTYLMWVDVSASGMDGDAFAEKLLHDHHICVNSGSHYGKVGKNFIRINLATQKAKLEEAFRKIKN
jgi:cystathionine beta-lyase